MDTDDCCRVGRVVAVAWEDNWYIGEVREVVVSEVKLKVTFMQRKGGYRMSWPRMQDIQHMYR